MEVVNKAIVEGQYYSPSGSTFRDTLQKLLLADEPIATTEKLQLTNEIGYIQIPEVRIR